MTGIFAGITEATEIYAGTDPVTAVYAGTEQIWPTTSTHLAHDAFNRADGALGSDWNRYLNAPVIYSSAARAASSNNADGGALWHEQMPTDDMAVSVKIASIPDAVQRSGLVLGATPNGTSRPRDYIGAEFNKSDCKLLRWVDGRYTEFAKPSWTLDVGDIVELSRVGTTITLRKNGTTLYSESTTQPPMGDGRRAVGFDARNLWQIFQPLYYSPSLDEWWADPA